MLKKMWKDPVWSKVISALIITVGGFIISLLYSLITDRTVKESILYLWNIKVALGPLIIISFLLAILTSIIKKVRTKGRTEIQSLESIFHEKYTKIVDNENNLTYRFSAYVGASNKFPYISELRVYCNNHDMEVLLTQYQGCNRPGCKHFGKGYNESILKQNIETYLLGVWEKMKA